MKPVVSFSVSTAENGWTVRRIDSHPEGLHGEYVFTEWSEMVGHLTDGLLCIDEIREGVVVTDEGGSIFGDAYGVLKEERDRLRTAVGFFVSAIKSGEVWTKSCDEVFNTLEKV